MTARLATSILVTALIRKAEADGGFAAVISKGDERAGAIILLLSERGNAPVPFERILQPDGSYSWMAAPNALAAEEVRAFVSRRKRLDPDSWVLDLNIPSRERFAAEMNEPG